VAVYTFGPENLIFKKFVTMKLLFRTSTILGSVDGTNFRVNTLKTFWWDGFDWRLLGGKKDPNANLINYGNIKHFSMLRVIPGKSLER